MSKIAENQGMIEKCQKAMKALEQALLAAHDFDELTTSDTAENEIIHHLAGQMVDNAVELFEIHIHSVGAIATGGDGVVPGRERDMLLLPGHSIIMNDGYLIGFKDNSMLSLHFSPEFHGRMGETWNERVDRIRGE